MNQMQVKAIFSYRDGGLFWIHKRGSNALAGARAGRLQPTGYRSILCSGRRYQEHRLIFLYHNGFMPPQLDHINGKKDDNRIENLREATYSQNQINTADRFPTRGIRKTSSKTWIARIVKDGVEIKIGSYASQDEAKMAYRAKAKELFGEFVRQV